MIAALGGGIAPGLDARRHRRRADAGSERHTGRAGRRRLAVDRRRQGRRADRGGLGLHHLPRQRAGPVDVGVGDRLRAGAQRCRRARALATAYATDPRFKVPYDQLLTSVDGEASLSPVLGPQREVRVATANAVAAIFGGADVATSLTAPRPVERADPELQRTQLSPPNCERLQPACPVACVVGSWSKRFVPVSERLRPNE